MRDDGSLDHVPYSRTLQTRRKAKCRSRLAYRSVGRAFVRIFQDPKAWTATLVLSSRSAISLEGAVRP